jgi:hypothetical protein
LRIVLYAAFALNRFGGREPFSAKGGAWCKPPFLGKVETLATQGFAVQQPLIVNCESAIASRPPYVEQLHMQGRNPTTKAVRYKKTKGRFSDFGQSRQVLENKREQPPRSQSLAWGL